tara:strand:+ start:124 stop:303 length:180 start_codon:yes stop_codon:yes gene_type:complete
MLGHLALMVRDTAVAMVTTEGLTYTVAAAVLAAMEAMALLVVLAVTGGLIVEGGCITTH